MDLKWYFLVKKRHTLFPCWHSTAKVRNTSMNQEQNRGACGQSLGLGATLTWWTWRGWGDRGAAPRTRAPSPCTGRTSPPKIPNSTQKFVSTSSSPKRKIEKKCILLACQYQWAKKRSRRTKTCGGRLWSARRGGRARRCGAGTQTGPRACRSRCRPFPPSADTSHGLTTCSSSFTAFAPCSEAAMITGSRSPSLARRRREGTVGGCARSQVEEDGDARVDGWARRSGSATAAKEAGSGRLRARRRLHL